MRARAFSSASLLLTKEAAFDELYRAIQDVLAPHPSRSSAEGVRERPMEKEDGR